MSIITTGDSKSVKDWPKPLCCNCRNRRNLQVCRDTKKSGKETIEECEGYIPVLPWR